MLKKISAALIVASMFAVPAMAASTIKTEQSPAVHSQTLKPSVANANAKAAKKTTKHSKHTAKKHTSALKTRKHVASAKKMHVAGLKKQKVSHKKG